MIDHLNSLPHFIVYIPILLFKHIITALPNVHFFHMYVLTCQMVLFQSHIKGINKISTYLRQRSFTSLLRSSMYRYRPTCKLINCALECASFFLYIKTHLSLVLHRQYIGLALVQIMAYCLFGPKPSSKPMLSNCQLDPYEQTSVKFQSKYRTIHSRKCNWKHLPWNGGHVVQWEMG